VGLYPVLKVLAEWFEPPSSPPPPTSLEEFLKQPKTRVGDGQFWSSKNAQGQEGILFTYQHSGRTYSTLTVCTYYLYIHVKGIFTFMSYTVLFSFYLQTHCYISVHEFSTFSVFTLTPVQVLHSNFLPARIRRQNNKSLSAPPIWFTVSMILFCLLSALHGLWYNTLPPLSCRFLEGSDCKLCLAREGGGARWSSFHSLGHWGGGGT
jgi:hypothetical protein